jgi:hypothetical protein
MAGRGRARRTTRAFTVGVSGDVTMDRNLAREPRVSGGEGLLDTRASWQRGGAPLLADLIEKGASGVGPAAGPVRVRAVEAATEPPRSAQA